MKRSVIAGFASAEEKALLDAALAMNSVTQRTREIGIRLALGAEVRQVRAMVVRQGMLLAAGGVGLAIAGAFGLSRVAAGLLHGIAGADALYVLGQLHGAAVEHRGAPFAITPGCNASPSAQCPESRLEVGSGYLLVGRRRRLYLVNQHGNITDLGSLSGGARRIPSHAGRLGRHRPDRHHGQSRMYVGRALGERVDHAGRFDQRSGRGEPRLLGGRQ
jgi:hypothetical protein